MVRNAYSFRHWILVPFDGEGKWPINNPARVTHGNSILKDVENDRRYRRLLG